MSIINLEAKLDSSWPSGAIDCAEPAGKRLLATGSIGGHKRCAQLCGKPSGAARLTKNMAIEDIEKLCPEIDHRTLSKDVGFLSYRDIFTSHSERARTGQSSSLVANSEGSRRGKSVRIEERCGERIQIPAI